MNEYETMLESGLEAAMLQVQKEFHDINSGGCGCMAVILGETLGQYFECRLAVMHHNSENSFYRIKDDIFGGEIDGLSMDDFRDHGYGNSHVWVEFRVNGNWWSMDCDCVSTGGRLSHWEEPCDERVAVEDFRELAFNPEGWNAGFDRDQLPRMEVRVQQLVLDTLFTTNNALNQAIGE